MRKGQWRSACLPCRVVLATVVGGVFGFGFVRVLLVLVVVVLVLVWGAEVDGRYRCSVVPAALLPEPQ